MEKSLQGTKPPKTPVFGVDTLGDRKKEGFFTPALSLVTVSLFDFFIGIGMLFDLKSI